MRNEFIRTRSKCLACMHQSEHEDATHLTHQVIVPSDRRHHSKGSYVCSYVVLADRLGAYQAKLAAYLSRVSNPMLTSPTDGLP